MNKEFKVVEPLDSLRYVASLFETRNVSHVLIQENGVLLGIISDRDVLRAIHPNTFSDIASNVELKVLNKTANQIMTAKPICIAIESAIISAGEIMLDNNISALPVMNDKGRVVGLVTLKGIVNYFVSRTRNKMNNIESYI
ncbi:CBS domain-containing protein [Paraneptunicella aestuarii]|uniref:CBS domain-containing protein n=1 Tax=Paraneptunicella aestuarii TaxID=2831148 RepID=UPI001E38DEED|nr:CBS domain-containing protein [Paraneptunicella aestuarii]UAA40089.1 CBS domain-containing protein [Paraneptunicella aestuarii]